MIDCCTPRGYAPHSENCPVVVANRITIRELEKIDARCNGCSVGIVLGPPPFPGIYHPHGYGPFYCKSCWATKAK